MRVIRVIVVIEATLGDILAGKVKAHRLYCLYIISDGENTIYIGSSMGDTGIINRIRNTNPVLKDFREFFLPESLQWQVTIMTLEECLEEYKDKKVGGYFPLSLHHVTYKWDVLYAERWLVEYHNSFINVIYNAGRYAPIPKKYLSFPCDKPTYPKILRERFEINRNWR
jgi:hypothetical protein